MMLKTQWYGFCNSISFDVIRIAGWSEKQNRKNGFFIDVWKSSKWNGIQMKRAEK